MVDAGAVGRHDGERHAVVGSAEQQGGQRHRQRHPAGRLAEGRRGSQRLVALARVEVVDAERLQGRQHLGLPHAGVELGAAGGVDAAERREGAASGGGQLERDVGEGGVHRRLPSSALDTIIRCTSMVPEATVAACA